MDLLGPHVPKGRLEGCAERRTAISLLSDADSEVLLAALLAFAEELARADSAAAVARALAGHVHAHFGADRVRVALRSGRDGWLDVLDDPQLERIPLDAPFVLPLVIRERRTVATSDPPLPGVSGGAALCAPLVAGDRVLGGAALVWDAPRQLTARDRRLTEAVLAHVALVLERVELQARARREVERQRYLARASEVLSGSLDPHQTLQLLADLAVPAIADWMVVDLFAPDDSVNRVAVRHIDPEKVALAHEAFRRYGPTPAEVAVLRTTGPVLLPELTDEWLAATTKDEAHLRLSRGLGFRSMVLVPLLARGAACGAITLVTTRDSGRTFDETDLELAVDLARRAGIAFENASLYREVEEADRRKDEFLAVLGHELRNPLAAVRTAVDVVTAAAADPGAVASAREVLVRQIRHMARMLDDLLDLSRITAGKLVMHEEPADLARIARETVADLAPAAASAGVTVDLRAPEAPLVVAGDATRLAQIIGNLLHNALKYTPAGGRVGVSVEVVGAEVVVAVEDQGCGIAPELLGAVFEPFVQGGPSAGLQGGLGLGLALVKGLVELHHGRVEAHSAGPGRGARFVVTLPLRDPPAAEPAPVASGRAARRVLVVEDNADAAEMLRLLLQFSGHEVEVAGDGPTALELAGRWRPEVVLCDIGLPNGMDGYAVARVLRERFGRQPLLVALTGFGQAEDQRRALAAGFDRHFTKPVDPDELDRLTADG